MFSALTQTRWLHLIALLSVGAVVMALISQYGFDMRPCAWCVFQRVVYLGIAALCWLTLALRHKPAWSLLGHALIVLLALGGALAAWHQYDVAANLFSCDLSFADRFMTRSGLDGGLPWLFGIQAACFDARAYLLGVEYAIWSLTLFLLLALLGILALSGRRPPP